MRRLILLPCLVAVCLAAFPLADLASAQMHEDSSWGFKVRVPSGWEKIPLQVNERWIIGKYMCNRSYVGEEGWNHKPDMKIVVFPEEVKKKKGKVDLKATENEEGWSLSVKFKYKSYPDYLKGNFAGGGWYFSQEEEGELAGVKVTRYEAKIEKLVNQKRRIIAWVYHLPDADVAVSFEVLEVRYKKLKGLVYGALKSFRLAERTGEHPMQKTSADAGSDNKKKTKKKKWKDMTPIERMKVRKTKTDRIVKAAIGNLPEGWKNSKSAHFVVLTHVDARATKKFVNQAEAIRGWLDKHFYEIGEDYVPSVILRVCQSTDEENAYQRGSADSFSFDSRELVVSRDSSGSRRWELEYLSQGICRQWFSDKNKVLYRYLPRWFSNGIQQYLGTALVKGRNLKFKPDDWERDMLRRGNRENTLITCQNLMKMTWKEYRKQYSATKGGVDMQCGSLVRYFMSSRVRKNKQTKGILLTYLRHLNDVAREIEKKRDAENKKDSKEAETEEEEEAQRKKEREQNEKQSRYIVDETFKRTFGTWTDKDWEKFERSWAKASL